MQQSAFINFNFVGARPGARAPGVGALVGAQLRFSSRSATRSATPKIQPERDRSATPDFAGALMLWFCTSSDFTFHFCWSKSYTLEKNIFCAWPFVSNSYCLLKEYALYRQYVLYFSKNSDKLSNCYILKYVESGTWLSLVSAFEKKYCLKRLIQIWKFHGNPKI